MNANRINQNPDINNSYFPSLKTCGVVAGVAFLARAFQSNYPSKLAQEKPLSTYEVATELTIMTLLIVGISFLVKQCQNYIEYSNIATANAKEEMKRASSLDACEGNPRGLSYTDRRVHNINNKKS